MLVEFRVENHRSLRDEQVLTMEAAHIGAPGDVTPREVPGHTEKLLPVAVLYGANASGKSNVLMALAFMREAVFESHRSWAPDKGVPRDPFAWGARREEPSVYEVTVLIYSVRYQYGFSTSDECFLKEWLYAWPNGKKQTWFERDKDAFKFGDNFKGENRLIEEVTRPNALFLSAKAQHRHPQLLPIFTWFRSLTASNLSRPVFSRYPITVRLTMLLAEILAGSQQPSLLEGEPPDIFSDQFRNMLRNADIGIADFRVVPDSADDGERPGQGRIQLKHKNTLPDAWLPLEQESKGTQMLLQLTVPILETLRKGSTLVIDELESSLHPSLAQQLVNMFNDPRRNPRNAQLIFTTHDTNLLGTTLGEPAVRRDQIWLTEKDSEGATVLYPLTDYKPRKAENIERGYLQGRYGAIPFLGNFALPGDMA